MSSVIRTWILQFQKEKKKSTILNHAKEKKKNRLDNCFCQDSVY